MKKLQWQRYQMLELIPDCPPLIQASNQAKSTSWLQSIWQIIDLAFLRDLEPRVWQSSDPHTGQSRWHLYNPETGKTSHLNSESEIRQWLEQLLHH
ncbi:MAG: hypothetical protein HC827_19070 [Cyanobacteria bacterium RM1_2_2]|nr:hypothetical protein [Cyanobacteria bacterium RM1_2_2]